MFLGQVLNSLHLKVEVDKLVEEILVEARVLRLLSELNALAQVVHSVWFFLKDLFLLGSVLVFTRSIVSFSLKLLFELGQLK